MDEDGVFRALADRTRRHILQILGSGELTAKEITSQYMMSAPSISRHLSVLKGSGLVAKRDEGDRTYYRVQMELLSLCLGGYLSAVSTENCRWAPDNGTPAQDTSLSDRWGRKQQ